MNESWNEDVGWYIDIKKKVREARLRWYGHVMVV
jgi:hypothetical protein